MLRDSQTGLYNEEYFNELLALEQKKCERSKSPVLLMLADLSAFADVTERQKIARSMMEALSHAIRDTDVKGWHVDCLVIGIMFTKITSKEATPPFAPRHFANRCLERLRSHLGPKRFSRIHVNWQVFPEEFPKPSTGEGPKQKTVLPAAMKKKAGQRVGLVAKRLTDVIGSVMAIVVFAPVLAGIAMWVKMSSRGPVLFRQERIGLGGKTFMLMKFRTMFANNDPTIHKEFVRNLISAGNDGDRAAGAGPDGAYKIKSDPRVTTVGRILRKTSLDELPQFMNVLKGDMSLVGPRPPIMYEYEEYDLWHRHRVLDIKPGITGLWQVAGRSVTTFDEMVRMDIKYIREWSLWLDIQIILKTPLVMLKGNGAY
jgi:lipopolysaccharide/colanic/teichoic acid biosynthesis glycosyltransferase